jgi:anaerobic magnesium-protoporphyrin IX monomethyl ester cyclase
MSSDRQANCVFVVFLTGHEVTQEHLGIGYLTSILCRDGHRCTTVPVPLGEDDRVVDHIAHLNPDWIGINLVSAVLPRATTLGQALRARLGPKVHICAGGPMVTFVGEWLWQHPEWHFLDSIVCGEGESVISPLVTAVLDGAPVHNLTGVAVRSHPSTSLATPIDDLDSIPWPARDLLDKEFAHFITSRGCTGCCAFCTAHRNMGTKAWRGRSPEDVVNEIESLIHQHGMNTLRIYDATYEDPGSAGKQRIRRIAELIMQRAVRVHYHIMVQAYSWTEDDIALLHLLHESGLERVYIGIESGSDRILRLMRKRASVDDNRRTINLFRQIPVHMAFGFIMFYPYVEWQDIEANLNFLSQTKLSHNLDLFTGRLEVLPGSEVAEQLAADGLLEPGYPENFDPMAYKYVNPQIGRMARVLNSYFYGKEIQRSGFPVIEGAVYDFLRLDMLLTIYISRLLRSLGDDPLICEAIDESRSTYHREIATLARFVENAFGDLVAWAKMDQDTPISIAETVERHFAHAARQTNAIRLRLAMNLARQGKDFRAQFE